MPGLELKFGKHRALNQLVESNLSQPAGTSRAGSRNTTRVDFVESQNTTDTALTVSRNITNAASTKSKNPRKGGASGLT